MYVLAVAAAIYITRRRWAKLGGDPDLVYDVAKWGFPAGLIGGRIYFLITTPSQIPDHWWGPFAIWDGGLGIWGGIAAGVGAGLWVLLRRLSRGATSRVFMDAAAPALLGRAGDRPGRQLLQPGTVRQALDAAVGAEDRAAVPAARLPAVRDLPADVPLRDHLGPVAGRPSWSGSATTARFARPACSRSTSPATRASGSSRRRCESTTRVHPRDAAELLDRAIGTAGGLIWFLGSSAPTRCAPDSARKAPPTAGYSRSGWR